MAKILPFDILKDNTLILDAKLNTDLGRYDIFGNAKGEKSFDLWMKRVEQVTKCDTTGWQEQCDVFRVLINDLKSLKEEDGKKGTMILIGALIHRYFRVITFYEKTCSESISFVSSFFSLPRTPLNSKFFQAIRIALQLEPKVKYNDFEKKDLAKLDIVTIVDSLTYFRDYMISEDENSQPQYEKYEHFKHKNDSEFVANLEELIEHYTEAKGAPQILIQYKAIRFLKSLAKQLHTDCQAVDNALDTWVKILNIDYPDFSQLNTLQLEIHLNDNVKSDTLREKIKMLFLVPSIQGQIDGSEDASMSTSEDKKRVSCLTHALFTEQMKTANLSIASFNLFGGYALLLQSPVISESLKFFMLKALGVEKDPSVNTSEDMADGIESLCDHLKSNPEINLDWGFFGTKQGFDTQLSKAIVSLNKQSNKVEGKLGLTLI